MAMGDNLPVIVKDKQIQLKEVSLIYCQIKTK